MLQQTTLASRSSRTILFLSCTVLLLVSCSRQRVPGGRGDQGPLQISGVYPHLAVFNQADSSICRSNGNECGIGAVVPWAGKLWLLTYSPHCPHGSDDKLYAIDEQLNMETRPESVGGTPASRMIHRESNQLIIGPYLIDSTGGVRAIRPSAMPGRWGAVARHLKDPANKVYFYDMEGALFEADVHSLEVNKLFDKPIPGWHGKGAYTAQGRLIIANNGEHKVFDITPGLLKAGGPPENDDEMGALAEWDGQEWHIVERKQFTDVTGPEGIYGSPAEDSPAWSIGWDKRSVILKLLEDGEWFTYRLPKSTHTYDHWGGWYTEWPRIREIGNGRMLMDMHGMFYDFPKGFTRAHSGGIRPISNHLRYVPDFCAWNGRLVLATDETSILENPFAGQSQSNLWFGQPEDLEDWGAPNGWGGPWMSDEVKAGQASDPFLLNGFEHIVLHLTHNADEAVRFTLETDQDGDNQWEVYKTVTVPAGGYKYDLFPEGFSASWIRLKADRNCTATAFFHLQSDGHDPAEKAEMFNGLAGIDDQGPVTAGLIRPGAHNRNLQFLVLPGGEQPVQEGTRYYEVDEHLNFLRPADDRSREVAEICSLRREFTVDEASVIVKDKTGTYRLPKTDPRYDKPFAAGWPRARRELESERYMFNAHGTFYEIPREAGMAAIRPITTHKKQILDFCTWRGLLVLSGTRTDAEEDGHYFGAGDGENSGQTSRESTTIARNGNTNNGGTAAGAGGDSAGLWFGAIDDLWKLGKPVGMGGPWKETAVKAGEESLPYLMTGYDKKTVELRSDEDAVFTLEVDFDHTGWHTYQTIRVPAGESIVHRFPEGFNAHWVRLRSDRDCVATAWFTYE